MAPVTRASTFIDDLPTPSDEIIARVDTALNVKAKTTAFQDLVWNLNFNARDAYFQMYGKCYSREEQVVVVAKLCQQLKVESGCEDHDVCASKASDFFRENDMDMKTWVCRFYTKRYDEMILDNVVNEEPLSGETVGMLENGHEEAVEHTEGKTSQKDLASKEPCKSGSTEDEFNKAKPGEKARNVSDNDKGHATQGKSAEKKRTMSVAITSDAIMSKAIQGKLVERDRLMINASNDDIVHSKPIDKERREDNAIKDDAIQDEPAESERGVSVAIKGDAIKDKPFKGKSIKPEPGEGKLTKEARMTDNGIENDTVQGKPANNVHIVGNTVKGDAVQGKSLKCELTMSAAGDGEFFEANSLKGESNEGGCLESGVAGNDVAKNNQLLVAWSPNSEHFEELFGDSAECDAMGGTRVKDSPARGSVTKKHSVRSATCESSAMGSGVKGTHAQIKHAKTELAENKPVNRKTGLINNKFVELLSAEEPDSGGALQLKSLGNRAQDEDPPELELTTKVLKDNSSAVVKPVGIEHREKLDMERHTWPSGAEVQVKNDHMATNQLALMPEITSPTSSEKGSMSGKELEDGNGPGLHVPLPSRLRSLQLFLWSGDGQHGKYFGLMIEQQLALGVGLLGLFVVLAYFACQSWARFLGWFNV